jgi:hypothetical protein
MSSTATCSQLKQQCRDHLYVYIITTGRRRTARPDRANLEQHADLSLGIMYGTVFSHCTVYGPNFKHAKDPS